MFVKLFVIPNYSYHNITYNSHIHIIIKPAPLSADYSPAVTTEVIK